MLKHPYGPEVSRPPRPQYEHAKSTSVSNVLYGTQDSSNSHYIDSLERFKKDYSVYDKEQREKQREKRMRILEERKNQQIERECRIKRSQIEYDQHKMRQENQSRHLCEIGVKKSGFSNGLAMNPITLEYHNNKNGYRQKNQDQDHRLKKMVRTHHIQNVSTCGYNLVNGGQLPSIAPLIPKDTDAKFEQKVNQFYQSKKLDPNADLHLNPKTVIPRHIGEVDRGNSFKRQIWQEEQHPFQSTYQSQFLKKPHEQMSLSRMQQYEQINERLKQQKKPMTGYNSRQANSQDPYLKESPYLNQILQARNQELQRYPPHQPNINQFYGSDSEYRDSEYRSQPQRQKTTSYY